MDAMEHMLGRPPHKVFYGENAIRGFARLFVQDAGASPDGTPQHLVGGVLMTDPDVVPTREDGTDFRHAELWICEVIVRPIERYRDTEGACVGMGLQAALTGDGLSTPTYATRVL